jgi:hypothetical protein
MAEKALPPPTLNRGGKLYSGRPHRSIAACGDGLGVAHDLAAGGAYVATGFVAMNAPLGMPMPS